MGSWSEACGFSGLEIGESDDAYVMLLKGPVFSSSNGPYTVWQPATTLIRGTYNDYGYLGVEDDEAVLKIFNQQSGLDIKNGDDFSLDDLDGIPLQRFWIHANIFDGLGALTPEDKYVYDIETRSCPAIKDIAEMMAFYSGKMEKTIRAASAKMAEYEGDARLMAMELTLMRLESSMTGEGSSDASRWYSKAIEQLIMSGQPIEPYMEAKRRNDLLEIAAGQLRKKISPSEGIGPQHGGHVASREFAELILAVQTLRKPDEDEEDDDD